MRVSNAADRRLTKLDSIRLRKFIAAGNAAPQLEDVLDDAEVVPGPAIPADVVTMYAKFVVRDLALARRLLPEGCGRVQGLHLRAVAGRDGHARPDGGGHRALAGPGRRGMRRADRRGAVPAGSCRRLRHVVAPTPSARTRSHARRARELSVWSKS